MKVRDHRHSYVVETLRTEGRATEHRVWNEMHQSSKHPISVSCNAYYTVQTRYETPNIVNTLSVQDSDNKAEVWSTLKGNKSSFLQIKICKNCRNQAKTVTVTHTFYTSSFSRHSSMEKSRQLFEDACSKTAKSLQIKITLLPNSQHRDAENCSDMLARQPIIEEVDRYIQSHFKGQHWVMCTMKV